MESKTKIGVSKTSHFLKKVPVIQSTKTTKQRILEMEFFSRNQDLPALFLKIVKTSPLDPAMKCTQLLNNLINQCAGTNQHFFIDNQVYMKIS